MIGVTDSCDFTHASGWHVEETSSKLLGVQPCPRNPGIETKVQFEHVDARFAKYTELRKLCMRTNECADICFRKTAFACNARNLKLS